MRQGKRNDIAVAADCAVGAGSARSRAGSALVLGLLLGGASVTLAQAALPGLLAPGRKDEDRLAASVTVRAADASTCTALVQDRITGATVALDCEHALPLPATRAADDIES